MLPCASNFKMAEWRGVCNHWPESDQSENATCTIDDQYQKINFSVTKMFKVTPTSPELTLPTPTCGHEFQLRITHAIGPTYEIHRTVEIIRLLKYPYHAYNLTQMTIYFQYSTSNMTYRNKMIFPSADHTVCKCDQHEKNTYQYCTELYLESLIPWSTHKSDNSKIYFLVRSPLMYFIIIKYSIGNMMKSYIPYLFSQFSLW